MLTELDISCLPKDLPEFITVDLTDLAAGNTVHLSDLKLPEGVEIPALTKGENLPVATIVIPRAVAAEEAARRGRQREIPTTVQKKEGVAEGKRRTQERRRERKNNPDVFGSCGPLEVQ